MSRHLSPGAQLLRSSRLFSIPPPLPRPSTESKVANSQMYRDSDTATTPYPIRQAIATTDSALSRGDWGFKRPLPLRKTMRASNPALRITAIDTVEHITDYETATDHTKTLEKFQELGVATVRRMGTEPTDPVKSSFDSEFDNTIKSQQAHQQRSLLTLRRLPSRWKYTGPIIDLMTEGEFQVYFERQLKGRIQEFAAFLDDYLRIERLKDMAKLSEEPEALFYGWLSHMSRKEFEVYLHHRKTLPKEQRFSGYVARILGDERNHGDILVTPSPAEPTEQAPASQPISASESQAESSSLPLTGSSSKTGASSPQAQVSDAEKEPREKDIQAAESTRRQTLKRRAAELDAEGLKTWNKGWAQYVQDSIRLLRNDTTVKSSLNKLIRQFLDMPNPPETAVLGMTAQQTDNLTTHPSAGISYLRTNSVIENHPLLGPRDQKTPYQARVLTARSQAFGAKATLGVAGFAVDEATTASGRAAEADDSVKRPDLETKGGRKIWVYVQDATVDRQGRVQLNAKRSGTQAEHVRNKFLPELANVSAAPEVARPKPLSVGEELASSARPSSTAQALQRLLQARASLQEQDVPSANGESGDPPVDRK